MVDQPCYPGLVSQMGTQLDNLDAHDGWQPSKGHAGAAVLPALCAFAERSASVSGPEALAAMVLGAKYPIERQLLYTQQQMITILQVHGVPTGIYAVQ
jgi:hypothetical protein